MRRPRALFALIVLVASIGAPGVVRATVTCTDASPAGGDWPLYGHDLSGTRDQADEHVLSPSTVGGLRPAWNSVKSAGDGGQSTPVIAGNCVYVAGSGDGYITAFDATNGDLVWHRNTSDPTAGGAMYGVGVADGKVYANVSPSPAPFGAALDADTGDIVYRSDPIAFGYTDAAVASAIAFNGMQLVPTQGPDADPYARPGIALLDGSTGEVLHAQTTIPEQDLDDGYAGGGIWATPVVDTARGYAYTGTANPYSKFKEHRYDNAIVKIDVDPDRPTFGTVVDAYKGNVDQFVPGLDRQPACDMFGDTITYHPAAFSVTCVQFDIDFGASPTMYTNHHGDRIIGELQKSGVFHAVYADTMESAWDTTLSTLPPATAGNASSAANDGQRIYVVADGGLLYALDGDSGRIDWVTPTADVGGYHPVSIANGVVYVMTNHGTLEGFDSSNGLPLWAANVPLDTGQICVPLAGGIAIAHNTVYAVCDGFLAAYRLP